MDLLSHSKDPEAVLLLASLVLAVVMTHAICMANRYAKMEALETEHMGDSRVALKAVHFSQRLKWEKPLNTLLIAIAWLFINSSLFIFLYISQYFFLISQILSSYYVCGAAEVQPAHLLAQSAERWRSRVPRGESDGLRAGRLRIVGEFHSLRLHFVLAGVHFGAQEGEALAAGLDVSQRLIGDKQLEHGPRGLGRQGERVGAPRGDLESPAGLL